MEVRTAEAVAERFGLEKVSADSWRGFFSGDGYEWAHGMQERGFPWLVDAGGWPYVVISRGEDCLIRYTEGDLEVTRYGIESESMIDLETGDQRVGPRSWGLRMD
jgi:hypothetical protein